MNKNSELQYDAIITAVGDGFETGHYPYDTEEFELFRQQAKEDGLTGNYRKLFDKYRELISLGPSGFYDMYSDKYDFSDEFKQEYADIIDMNESNVAKEVLKEMKVMYNLSDSVASKLRTAADESDVVGVLNALISAYEELYDAGIIDIDDYERYVEEVDFVDPDDIDEAEYQLQEFFDLCDNIGIFIPVIYEEVSLEEEFNGNKRGLPVSQFEFILEMAQQIGLKNLADLKDFLRSEGQPNEDTFSVLLRYRASLGNDFNIADPDHPKEQSKYAKSSINSNLEESYEDAEFDDVDHINVVDIPEESDDAVKAEPCCQAPSKTVKMGENDIDIGVDFEADDIDA